MLSAGDDLAQEGLHFLSLVSAFTYDRLDKDNVVLLVVDHQEGLYQMARDMSAVEMKANILAHAALGKVFNLPVVMTSSADTGTCLRSRIATVC